MQRRWKVSSAQRADLWNRWKAGQSLNAIGRALGKDQHVIHFLLARHGGIVPRVRHRSRRVLTLGEREDISRGIAGGCSLRVIAQRLRRASSTVSRKDQGVPWSVIHVADTLPKAGAVSTGQCNTCLQSICRSLKSQSFSWTLI